MTGLDLSFGGTEFPRAAEVRRFLYENSQIGMTTRYRRLDRHDAWYKCLEYDHHKYDWNGYSADQLETISPLVALPQGFTQPAAVEDIPVRMRRPTAPLRLCPYVVDRFTGLLFSEERTPEIGVEGDDDADDFIKAVFDQCKFWSTMYSARTYGGAQGSTLVTLHLKEGRFSYKAHPGKVVQDILWLDRDRLIPTGVLIQYLVPQEFEVLDNNGRPSGQVETKFLVYRRIIDEEWDVVFKLTPVGDDGKPPLEMEVDEEQTVRHALGKFPGAWVQNLPNDEDIDGVCDCDGAFQMFDTIDRLYSQANFALLYNMDPTLVLSVDPKQKKLSGPIRKGSKNALDVGPSGSATYLEISGSGVTMAIDKADNLTKKALDKVGMVRPDPSQLATAQSAKAIELLYAPTIEKAGRLREQYGEAIQQLADLTLEYARLYTKKVMYPGNVKAIFDLQPKIEEIDPDPDNPNVKPRRSFKELMPGRAGQVSVSWGAYFPPTPTDIQTETTTIAAAKDAHFLDTETAIKKVAPLFDVKDVPGLIRKIREEEKESEGKRSELMGFGGMPEEEEEEDEGFGLEEEPEPPSGTPGGFA